MDDGLPPSPEENAAELASVIELAAKAGTLLSDIAAERLIAKNGGLEAFAKVLAKAHIDGRIDLIRVFEVEDVEALPSFGFFDVQMAFCTALPLIDSTVDRVAPVVLRLVRKGGADLAANQPNAAFLAWCRQSAGRAEAALQLVESNMDAETGILSFALQAGADHDLLRSVETARKMADDHRVHVRLAAISALGRMDLSGQPDVQAATIEQLLLIVGNSGDDAGRANALQSIIQSLGKSQLDVPALGQRAFLAASTQPGPLTRYVLADALWPRKLWITPPARTIIWKALASLRPEERGIIDLLDLALSEADFETERTLAFEFLSAVVGRSSDPIPLSSFDSFLHKLRKDFSNKGAWYLASLLISGSHTLAQQAHVIADNVEVGDCLNVDLGPVALDSKWLVFLCKKVLGYLATQQRVAAALFAACLAEVTDEDAPEVAEMLFSVLLLNFPSVEADLLAIANVRGPALKSRLQMPIQRLNEYIASLDGIGSINELHPSERARHLNAEKQHDFWRNVRRQANEMSIFKDIITRSVMLYGSRSVSHVYQADDEPPRRVEIPMMTHEHRIEWPRIEVLDPVGFQFRVLQFRIARAPS